MPPVELFWLATLFFNFNNVAGSCTQPFALPVQNVTLSNGFTRRGVPLSLGTPSQLLSFRPMLPGNNTYVYGNDNQACSQFQTGSGACITYRGGFYSPDSSTSRMSSSVNASGADPFDSTIQNSNTSDVTWSQDIIQLGGNTTLNGYPLGVLEEATGNDELAQQNILGLGANSTLLNTLKSAGRIASRSFGMFYGLTGATPSAQMDGSLVLGGYDRAKVVGQGVATKFISNPICPTNMLVTLSGLVLNYPNGSDIDVLAEHTEPFQACILPSFPSLIAIPDALFNALTSAWEITNTSVIGFNDVNWATPFGSRAPFDGDMTLKMYAGSQVFSVKVPNSQLVLPNITYQSNGDILANTSQRVALVNNYAGFNSLGKNLVLLGRTFLSAAYLMVNQDSETFTLWQANATTNSDLVGVDESGNDMSQNCSQPATNITAPSGSGSGNGTSSSSTSSKRVSHAASAGIAVGAIAVMAAACLGLWLCYRKRKNRITNQNATRDTSARAPSGYYRDSPHSVAAYRVPQEMTGDGRLEMPGESRPNELPSKWATAELPGNNYVQLAELPGNDAGYHK